MLNVTHWFNEPNADERDLQGAVAEQRGHRLKTLDKITHDIVAFAVTQGYTETQARNAIEDLFRTFVSDWFLYTLIGSDDIITSITNDVTLGWLDIDAGGVTVRQRLINRLS